MITKEFCEANYGKTVRILKHNSEPEECRRKYGDYEGKTGTLLPPTFWKGLAKVSVDDEGYTHVEECDEIEIIE